ncbi:MAG TPA: hypothetical protein PLC79_00815 [Phycisphaerae bacterium]|nr:hypothetical protein [Phycisphaerae bacterium]
MIGPLRKLVLTEDGRTKPAGAIAVVLVLVVSCSALGYYIWKGGLDLGGGEPQLDSAAKCWTCGYECVRRPTPGEPTVAVCPKCGKQTLAPAFRCKKCKTLVVLNEYRGGTPPTKCPKCGTEVRHGD